MRYLLIISLIFLMACPNNNGGGTPTPTPTPAPTPQTSYLKIHPVNPRYFQDAITGKPVLIAAFENLVPADKTFDDLAQIASMKARGLTYARVWHLTPWAGDNAFWPWLRIASNKWDFSKWEPEYWTRMHKSLKAASDAGIVSEIMLFDRVGMSPASDTRWNQNPWASDNNINNLETPKRHLDGTPEFYQFAARPNLQKAQQEYVRKILDETYKYNVIYEVENEHWENNDPAWAHYWAQFIKDHLAQKQVNRLVSYNSLQPDLESFYQRDSVDVVNKHYGQEPENDVNVLNDYIETRWRFNKPINIDEFANGLEDPDILRKMLWVIVTSGGHFHIEDARPESKPTENTQAIIKFLKDSQWDFIASAPQKGYSPSGYCMVSEKEKLCYYLNSGTKTMPLSAGDYKFTWYKSSTGEVVQSSTFNHSGGSKSFTTPSGGDHVLLVKAQ